MKSFNTLAVAVLMAIIAIFIATPAQAGGISMAEETVGGKFAIWGGLANSDGVEIEAPSDYNSSILTGQVKKQFTCGFTYAVVAERLAIGLTIKNGRNSAFGAPDPINWGGQNGLYQVRLSETVLLAGAAVQTSWFIISSLPEWMRFQALAGGHIDLTGRNITLERYDDGYEFSEEMANIRMHNYFISLRAGAGTNEIGMVWLGINLGRKIGSVSYTGGNDGTDVRSKNQLDVSVELGLSR